MQAINHNGLILHSVTWLAMDECCLYSAAYSHCADVLAWDITQ